jgi:hypothetical protein
MLRGVCDRCHRDYALNPESHVQATCPRCRQPLRLPRSGPTGRYGPTPSRPWCCAGVMLVGLLCLPLGRSLWRPTPRLLSRYDDRPIAEHPEAPPDDPCRRETSPSRAARRQGWQHWMRAQEQAAEAMDALERWDPESLARQGQLAWRRQWLANDPSGEMGQAKAAALEAAVQAQAPEEAYGASLPLARIHADLGNREAELQQARRLMALAPGDERSLNVLALAARDNGLKELTRQTETALEALHANRQKSEWNGARSPARGGGQQRRHEEDTGGRVGLPAPRSALSFVRPFEAEYAAALLYRTRVKLAVAADLAAREAVFPSGVEPQAREMFRRQLLAVDGTGDLHRAERAAQRAATLAQTRAEK